MPPPSRWRRLAVAGVAAAAAAYVAYQWWYAEEEDGIVDDGDDEGTNSPPQQPPDLSERSLTSWAGAAEAEAAARRRRREEEEAEEARLLASGTAAATSRPAPVEVEMEAVVARGGRDGAVGDDAAGQSPPKPPPDPAAAAIAAAAADLDRHFESVQSICDGVTLPAAARDLGAALVTVADVAGLTARLRGGGSADGGGGDEAASTPPPPPLDAEAKLAAWAALRDAAFTSAVGAPWLVAGLALALRVQLNVLGRHLFLAAHVGGNGGSLSPPPPPAGGGVSTAAQARLLEYGHYFVRSGAATLLAGAVAPAAAEAVTAGGLDLGTPLSADALLDRVSAAHASVEGAVSGWSGGDGTYTGWVALLLPPPTEAAALLAAGEAAAQAAAVAASAGAPGPSALPPSLAADAALVRGMADELGLIYASPRFAVAARAAVAAVAAQAAAALAASVGPADLPLAKAVPRAAAVGRSLLDPASPAFAAAAEAVGLVPEVRELCAAVYSCGPPL